MGNNSKDLSVNQVNTLARQVTAMHDRVAHLLYEARFIPSICPELGVAVDRLQIAVEELQAQNEALEKALTIAVTEQQRDQELFTSLPDAYVVTDSYWRFHQEPGDRPATTVTCMVTVHHTAAHITTFRWLIRESIICQNQLESQQHKLTTKPYYSPLPLEID